MSHWTDSKLQALIGHTKRFLESIGGTDALDRELSYYGAELRKCFPTLNHVWVRLCDSVRNTTYMRLVISDTRFQAISEQLLRTGLNEFATTPMGLRRLTNIIESACQVSANAQQEKRSWSVFKQGAVDGARYLNRFADTEEFYRYIDGHTETADSAWNLALQLSKEIKGIGPVLACDFFKEIGIGSYGKPDLHIKRILTRLNLINETNQDKQTFIILWHLSQLTHTSPATVDKILWMAGSGRWDRTLDTELNETARKRQRLLRKQGFDSLLQQLIKDY